LRSRFLHILVLAATLQFLLGTAAADAASPTLLGQTATSSTGSCGLCSVLQLEDSGTPTTYEVPTDGVLTRFLVYVGSEVNASDRVQLRTFRRVGPSSAAVISAGAQHSLSGATLGTANTFYDRVPAKAGDVLGARFEIFAHSVDATPPSFSSGSASDLFAFQLGSVSDPGVGETFSPASNTGYRANVAAWLEPDLDHDDYGDVSQDLCPGSPVATDACSGSLFGSRLQGVPSFRGACGYACMRVQRTVGGASTAAPYDGVVVRWRVLAAPAGDYRIRVLGPGGGTGYKVLRSSAAETVGSDGQLSLKTFESRLPIPSGGYVGLAPPPFTGPQDVLAAPGATYTQVNDGPDGSEGDFAGYSSISGEALYDADIEPDADHDGYGDITQDACPTDASTQGVCPPAPEAGQPPSSSSPPGIGRPPVISGFKATPKRFRVTGKSHTPSHKPRGGTTLSLRLSEAASVVFDLEKKASCKSATHARAAKRCAKWTQARAFSRDLAAGPSSISYSGRYRRRGKVQSLAPGAYRMSAIPTDTAGRMGAAAQIALTVVR
jgi:hypothetical protein